MNRRGVAPSVRARILQLRARGCPAGIGFDSNGSGGGSLADTGGRKSYRAIMAVLATEGVELTDVTIRNVVRDAEAKGWDAAADGEQGEPVLVQVRGTGPAQGGRGTGGGTGASAGEVQGEGAEQAGDDAMPELPEDASAAARALYEDIRDSRNRLRALPIGDDHATSYSTIARVKLQQVNALAKLLPPPKPDPMADPTNINSRERIRAALGTMESVKVRFRAAGGRWPGDPR